MSWCCNHSRLATGPLPHIHLFYKHFTYARSLTSLCRDEGICVMCEANKADQDLSKQEFVVLL